MNQHSSKRQSEHSLRILLLHAWGNENAGDKALAAGAIECIRRNYPLSKVTVVSVHSERNDQFHETQEYLTKRYSNIEVVPNDLRFVFSSSLPNILTLLIHALGFVYPPVLRRFYRNSVVYGRLFESDIVLRNGGHHIFWSNRMGQQKAILFKYLFPLILARRLKVPYGLHAQSFGPFEFSIKHWLVKCVFYYVLSGAAFISCRESASVNMLQEFMPRIDRPETVLDAAMFITGRDSVGAMHLLDRYSLRSGDFVAFTMRLSLRGSHRDIPSDEFSIYSYRIVQFLSKWTTNQSIPIAIVCQVPRDIQDAKYVLSRLSQEQRKQCRLIENTCSPETLVAFYAHCKCLIGMRFHSLIFALISGMPVGAIYYYDIGPKIEGIMKDIGQSKYSIRLDNVSAQELYEMAVSLVQEAPRLLKFNAVAVFSLLEMSSLILCRQISDAIKIPKGDREYD